MPTVVMFKGEYQGGPYVEVFSAQGRDTLSKKCKVTGSSTSIRKEYERDVKSYVYVLEGEPTTTKIKFPKEDKPGLFLTQKFLVFQLHLSVGRPFSLEVTVTDHAQNKRRIFFSSNLKDVSLTPLHARFPLTILNLGSWLNMCLDLESLVSQTFNVPKFRAVESFTVTANCKLRKVFTLRSPPVQRSENEKVVKSYSNAEPLPRNLQLITTPGTSAVTQILSYEKLCSKLNESPTTPLSTPSNHDCTTPREDLETHIAFGTKIVIPAHVRRNSLKENRESGKLVQSQVSSLKMNHGKSASDVRYTTSELIKSPLYPRQIEDKQNGSRDPECVEANLATIQPRPPRASSAGKIRRPIRLKSSNTGKSKTPENIAIEKQGTSTVSERHSGSIVKDTSTGTALEDLQDLGERVVKGEHSNQERSKIVEKSETVKASDKNGGNEHEKLTDRTILAVNSPGNMENQPDEMLKNGKEDNLIYFNGKNSEMSISTFQHMTTSEHDDSSEMDATDKTTISIEKIEQKHVYNASYADIEPQHSSSDAKFASDGIDMNNNDPQPESDENKPPIRPRKLPLASNNPVFTFASVPRSPCSGRRKLMDSHVADDVNTTSFEVAPEVMVSLAEEAISNEPSVKSGQSKRNRGASLEDDFCKLSDDDYKDDENADGIQKLLQSSISPRHSPMPVHHQLRQSVKSSMLKEIPSPIKDNGYDAQNYQSNKDVDALNQSTASSWRFDTSDSSNSFNQTSPELYGSRKENTFPNEPRKITEIFDIPLVGNEEDCHSDCSDETTCSTWRAPPQDLRGNKYQNEMKPPGQKPDLTATICMDAREYCDVFSPPITPSTPNKEDNRAILNLPLVRSPNKVGGGNTDEEELDLLYDPCLNCYFDPTTHKYYELA